MSLDWALWGRGVVRRPAHGPGLVQACLPAGLGPGRATDFIEGIGGPLDDMERVGTTHRAWASLGDDGDPCGAVRGNMGDPRGSLWSEGIEERSQGGLVLARGRPDQPARIVVHDDGQKLVSALVGNLIDTDPGQPGERVVTGDGVGPDSGDNRADRALRDPHQGGDR